MGKAIDFRFQMDESLEKQLTKLENFDSIAEKLLKDASPIIEESVKSECGIHSETHAMVDSVKSKKPAKNKSGWYVVVRPTGKDENGVRNMAKMVWIEYGYFNKRAKHFVAPKPILTKALNGCREKVLKMMQETLNKKMDEGR